MVNLPNPPTDNLYKFVAICGLVLVVAAFAFPAQRQMADNDWLIEQGMDYNKKSLEDSRKILLEDLPVEKIEKLLTIQEKIGEVALKHIETEAKLRSKYLDAANKGLYSFMFKIGWTFMILGFSSWYFRVQRFQDKLIAAESQKAHIEANKA